MEDKLVSIIIPTYKRAYRLDKAVNSVLSQSYLNIEIIVVDDNNDGDEYRYETEKLMKTFENNSKVRYIKHSVNKNGSAARNTGIATARGFYIAFLDDDDIFFNDKIEKQIRILESNEDYAAVCCAHISQYKQYIYKKNILKKYPDGNYLTSLLSGENILAAGSTLLIKKSVVEDLKGFDESFRRHQDWEFLTRFFRNYKMKILNENLVSINVDGERNYPEASRFYEIKMSFLDLFKNDIDRLGEENKKKIYNYQIKEIILVFWKQGKFNEGIKIANKYKNYFKINLSFLIIAIYSIMEYKLPFMNPLKYKLMSLKYWRR